MPKHTTNAAIFAAFQEQFLRVDAKETQPVPQVYDKDIKDIKNGFKLDVVFESTMIVVVAIHKDPTRNHKVKIPCVGCIPLTGYVYSAINDTYSVHCAGHLSLGTIQVGYKAKMRGTGGWELRVPMPVAVIRRYLGLEQRRLLREFQDGFKDQGEVAFEFVQMSSAY